MKLALMSVTYAGFFYRGGAITLEDLIPRVADLGFDGIEILGRRPHGFPLDLNKEKRDRLRELAKSKEIEIVAIGAQTDFSYADARIREWCLLDLRETVRLARDLGTKIVRVFGAGFEQMHSEGTYLEQWNWIKNCLKEAIKFAEEDGIILALHNHAPIMQSYRSVLEMIDEVGSEHLKVCLDPHCLWWAGEPINEAVRECGDLVVLSHLEDWKTLPTTVRHLPAGIQKLEGCKFCPLGKGDVDHKTFVTALKEIGYESYLSYPICDSIHRGHELELVTITYIDELVKHALQYMKNLISKA